MSGHILRGHPISATKFKEILSETKIIKKNNEFIYHHHLPSFTTFRLPAFQGDVLIDLVFDVLLRAVCGRDLLPHL